jgi:hypothetical protein
MVRLPQWQFVDDENHAWHWICTAERVRVVSASSFTERVDCLLDAVRTAVHARRRPVAPPMAIRHEPRLGLRLHDSLIRARRTH